MTTPREKSPLDIYHIVSVGVAKQTIFADKYDFEEFSKKLHSDTFAECEIVAWCLMTNHFHLLIKGDLNDVSRAMATLLSSYTRIFNNRHGRVGPLFQGRYYSEAIADERQLLCAVRYIHQNPDKANIGSHENYQWSSYQDFLSTNQLPITRKILAMFGGRQKFAEFHRAEETRTFLDEHLSSRISDSDALLLLREFLQKDPLGNNAMSDRWRRAALIRRLKSNGISTAQIQRITGLSINQVRYSLYSKEFD